MGAALPIAPTPTRNYRIPPPSRSTPPWLVLSMRGDHPALKKVVRLPPVPKGRYGRVIDWARFSILSGVS